VKVLPGVRGVRIRVDRKAAKNQSQGSRLNFNHVVKEVDIGALFSQREYRTSLLSTTERPHWRSSSISTRTLGIGSLEKDDVTVCVNVLTRSEATSRGLEGVWSVKVCACLKLLASQCLNATPSP
jgi:hypothetical protein